MADTFDQTVSRTIAGWVRFCHARAFLVLAVAALLSIAAATYLSHNLRIDTDTEDMLSAELPFRKDAIALDQAFPDQENNILVVVEGRDADAVADCAAALSAALSNAPEMFSSVFAPEADPFLKRNGLLYESVSDLDELSARLASAQPFLGTLWRAPNLAGLAGMVDLLASEGPLDSASAAEAARVLGRMPIAIDGDAVCMTASVPAIVAMLRPTSG